MNGYRNTQTMGWRNYLLLVLLGLNLLLILWSNQMEKKLDGKIEELQLLNQQITEAHQAERAQR